MPLDAGPGPDGRHDETGWTDPHRILTESATVGAALRAARERSGQSIEELSAATRVHVRYLRALEQNDFTILPSQVFALGYVRAAASALGLDEQLAAERFRRESPHAPVGLQPPTGVDVADVRQRSPRVFIAAGAALVLAVVGWNVFQRVNLMQAPPQATIAETPETWSLGSAPGVVRLGAPRAAPPDQTVPALYITPGLEAELSGLDPESENEGAARPDAPVQRAFNPRGATYGAASTASNVVIQAQRAASIVVRMADGRVLFARQLAAGEAWRAPQGVAATIDVSEPSAFTVYLNGEYEGALSSALTPLAGLNARAQAAASQAAAQVAQRAATMSPGG